jgi:hypothetical protein
MAPHLLLWGAEIPLTSDRASRAETRLAEISRTFGEAADRRTETDVVLDFESSGVIVIEVKLGSANDKVAERDDRWKRYVNAGFGNPSAVQQSGLYELTRNWRFAIELASGRPFTLVNLGGRTLFKDRRLDTWSAALDRSSGGRFVRMTWGDLLGPLTLESWMGEFCDQRGILPLSRRRDRAASEGTASGEVS